MWLKEAHLVLLKEKADVKAMHDHTHGDEDQARQSHPDSNRATFANPLQEQRKDIASSSDL